MRRCQNQMSFEIKTSREKASGPGLCSSRPSLVPMVSSRRWLGKNCGEQKITLVLGAGPRRDVGKAYRFRSRWVAGGKRLLMTWGRLTSVCNRDPGWIQPPISPDLYQLSTATIMQHKKQSSDCKHGFSLTSL